jgi:trans-aconitate 2-methyltransferase
VVDVRWDPRQYAADGDERSRAFFELLARVRVDAPADVVDLGCGPGALTAALSQRWPQAQVVGVDSSPDMVAAAAAHAAPGRLEFVRGDVATWSPAGEVDVVVANAVLHWIPDHVALLARFASWLRPGGALAFQVPDNFGEPSHTLLRDLRMSPRWRSQLGSAGGAGVQQPETYLHALVGLGLQADVWQTTYLHVLRGADPVLEWVKGTTLRPVLSLIESPADRDEFLREYAAALRAAYPPAETGTVFPFRRTFAVAARRQRPGG